MTFCIVVDLIPHLQIPPKLVHLFLKKVLPMCVWESLL